MRVAFAFAALLAVVLVGCKLDPSSADYWDKRLSDAKPGKGKVKVVEELRDSKHLTPTIYPVLHKHLSAQASKSAEVRMAIARVLGEQKDKSAVEPLIAAVDFGATEASENSMNKEIAIALANIGDPKAVSTLTKMVGARDRFTSIAAIDALGEMGSSEGFEVVHKVLLDEATPNFIASRAIIALGNIGDPKAVPTLARFMFFERAGVSFYREASFALYQMGAPAAEALLPALEGKDKELSAWAKKNRVEEIALAAKAAQVLGDLHDARAEKALLNMLAFQSEFVDIKLIMRTKAADALARMRSKAAVKPLSEQLLEPVFMGREQFVWALARIGGDEAVPKLVQCAAKGTWEVRQLCVKGVAALGNESHLGAFDKFVKDEPAIFAAECKEDPEYADCKSGVKEAVAKHIASISGFKGVLEAAKECKNAACWAKKLDDKSAAVRERAAHEVGRSKDGSLVKELTSRLREKDLDVRLAIIQGCDWLVEDSPEALQAAQAAVPDLSKQLAEEKGKTEFAKVNEDLRRLHVRLTRGKKG